MKGGPTQCLRILIPATIGTILPLKIRVTFLAETSSKPLGIGFKDLPIFLSYACYTNMKSKRQIVYEKAFPFAQANLQKIEVQMGEYDGSGKCQHVARNLAEKDRSLSVSAVLSFVPKSGMNVHFVNKDKDGQYIDNTLGYLSKRNIYFLLKDYDNNYLINEDIHMDKLLTEWKEKILQQIFSANEAEELNIVLTDL